MIKRLVALPLTLCTVLMTIAQVVTVDPPFPTVEDVVTITFYADQGNAALEGVSPVYAHMGLITENSTSPTDWQNVQGNWGTADPNTLMTEVDTDVHQITVDIDEFYGISTDLVVLELAFVFRNASGNIVGRADDGSDIYYPVYPVNPGLQANFVNPTQNFVSDPGEEVLVSVISNTEADIEIIDNGDVIASASGVTELEHTLTVALPTEHELVFTATVDGDEVSDTIRYVVNGEVEVINPPALLLDGVNYVDGSTVRLQLHAPGKDYIYVLGDFNNYEPDPSYYMHLADDLETWWIEIDGLTPGETYTYQFWIDGELELADPCSALILDPNADGTIPSWSYPEPIPYPEGASGFVSVMTPGADEFQWQNDNWDRPEKKDLVIYELHMRDFLAASSYAILIDSLDYLENLGINAIHFMPPGEYENNDSWGYNPSFHMALDKYYGTPEMFKELVDELHGRGIAVIIDLVHNHAFSQSPLVQMYWDPQEFNVTADNPWFNQVCPHEPFCWGYDFNHEVDATKRYMDRVNRHWIEEYHVDGFRMDFTKGFVNNNNGNYDNTRIQNLQRMADAIWSIDPESYVILEHFTGNSEEIILSDYGMMLWGNLNYAYGEAAMGWTSNSNFEWGIYLERGWNNPHLVTYMESHDEERMAYRTQTFGNSSGDYDTQDFQTAMARSELAAVFFLSQPGPKLIWQFGELGYDVSIDVPCRVCPKPVLWNYYEENPRRRLYDVYSAMINLRNTTETFGTSDIDYSLSGNFKRINLYNPEMDAVIIGNFGVSETSGVPNFPYTGTWYDYFTGEPIIEENLDNAFLLQPGEYRVYTSEPLADPEITVSVEDAMTLQLEVDIFPNPAVDQIQLNYTLAAEGRVEHMILDAEGRIISRRFDGTLPSGEQVHQLDVSSLAPGAYHLLIAVDGVANAYPFVKNN